ncbi:Tna1p [Sugiyamaella lignohabitans]|uniref:Tna1p n=1 Tax=Sugiyamaella lignohabitans TaxID=796027 RepID=A0A167EMY7_9ASCO|nr:Tna1p [Sugiyamaella lignohabitans]ANB14268.1 Tna1p [Sugiyamaella lignohabitans]
MSESIKSPSAKVDPLSETNSIDIRSPSVESGYADDVTPAEKKALVRKIDRRIVPPVTLLFLLSFLDRSNIANAKLFGLVTDLHMSQEQYLVTLSVFFVGYCLFEIPSNIILKRTSPKIWLPLLMVLWGIVGTLMALSQSYGGLLAARFWLGWCEAGVFPGIVFYLSLYYKRQDLLTRITLFWSSSSLAGAFGGILGFGIGKMDGIAGKRGWFWIFVIESLATIVLAVVCYFLIQDIPQKAKFLNERDQVVIKSVLAEESDSLRNDSFSWKVARDTFKDYRVYLYTFTWMGQALPLYSFTLFFPSIIANLGFTAAQAQLMTVPPYVSATLVSVGIAVISQKHNRRAPYIIGLSALSIIGYILILSCKKVGVQYLATFFIVTGLYSASALIFTWMAANVSGQVKRAVAQAIQISIGDIGAIVGCQVYRPNQAPTYPAGHGVALGFLGMSIITTLILWYTLDRENKRRDEITNGPPTDKSFITGDDFTGDDDVRWRYIK